MMIKLTQLPQPVIARVHGIATAAGCQLVSMRGMPGAYEIAGRAMVRNVLLADAVEGMDAFLKKREPAWRNT
jgi:enoyl-CoA hydratase/carnithine racemase